MPWIGATSPLESKEQAHDGADQEDGSEKVDLLQLLLGRHVRVAPWRIAEKEEDSCQSHAAEREVDPETPSPAGFICQRTAENGSDDRSDAKHAGERGNVDGAFAERDGVPNDVHASRKEGGGARSGDSSPDNQHLRASSGSAEDRAELEYEQGAEVDPFDVEVGIHLAEARLQRSGREQIARAIPSHIV